MSETKGNDPGNWTTARKLQVAIGLAAAVTGVLTWFGFSSWSVFETKVLHSADKPRVSVAASPTAIPAPVTPVPLPTTFTCGSDLYAATQRQSEWYYGSPAEDSVTANYQNESNATNIYVMIIAFADGASAQSAWALAGQGHDLDTLDGRYWVQISHAVNPAPPPGFDFGGPERCLHALIMQALPPS